MVRKVSASRIEDSSSPSESSSSTSSDGSTESETVARVSTEADLSVSVGKLTAVAKKRMEGKGKGVDTASKKKRRLLSSGVSILPVGTSRTERPPTAPRSTRSVGEVTVSRVGNEPPAAIPLEKPSTDRPLEPAISLDPEDPGREGPPTYYANPQMYCSGEVFRLMGLSRSPGTILSSFNFYLLGAPGGGSCAPFLWRLGVLPKEAYVIPEDTYVVPEEIYALHFYGLGAPGGDLCAPFLWRLGVLPKESYVIPEDTYVVPEEIYALHFYGLGAPGGDLCAPFLWRLGAPGEGLRAPGGDLCAPFLWRLECSRRRLTCSRRRLMCSRRILMCSISMET
ncbi:hypothetical protein LWI29_021564 [Acer saccharum]|uniref:Uncharacterized protein n=1 Tax=Acer saccharum TaxID=4024 RepID=A0AA39UV53_ACESA|nr:hypothetical protein LWI29_021564 [Acer saccharum]